MSNMNGLPDESKDRQNDLMLRWKNTNRHRPLQQICDYDLANRVPGSVVDSEDNNSHSSIIFRRPSLQGTITTENLESCQLLCKVIVEVYKFVMLE